MLNQEEKPFCEEGTNKFYCDTEILLAHWVKEMDISHYPKSSEEHHHCTDDAHRDMHGPPNVQ